MSATIPKAASHPDYPVLSGEELVEQVRQLTHLIELCGASVELTDAVTAASDIGFHLRRYADATRKAKVDRDVKAANLQLLVDKVLDYKEAAESAVGGPDHIDTYEAERLLDDTVALARSLKQ